MYLKNFDCECVEFIQSTWDRDRCGLHQWRGKMWRFQIMTFSPSIFYLNFSSGNTELDETSFVTLQIWTLKIFENMFLGIRFIVGHTRNQYFEFWWYTQCDHFCVVFLNWWLFTQSRQDKNRQLFITSRQIGQNHESGQRQALLEKARTGDWNPEEIKRSNLMWLDCHQKLLFDHDTHCPFPQTKMGYRSVRIEAACRHWWTSMFSSLISLWSLDQNLKLSILSEEDWRWYPVDDIK